MVAVVILVVDDNHQYVHVPMIPKKKYPRLGVVTGSNIRGTSLV